MKKTVFQDEGYDLTRVSEPIYYLKTKDQTYELLTPELSQSILRNDIKF